MARYMFFDRTVDLVLPDDVAAQWDLLYGAFRTAHDEEPFLCVRCSDQPDTGVRLEVDGQIQSALRKDVLIHIQLLIQNRVLPSVQSRMLWHGAAWSVDGHGIMVLGESGLGKTTLSLTEQVSGGRVLSDEIAAWNPGTAHLEPFPRSLAVRPDTLGLLGDQAPYPRLHIDEEKVVVPIASAAPAVPLKKMIVLEWAVDETVTGSESVCELRVVAQDTQWQRSLAEAVNEVEFHAHPDGMGWWRCCSRSAIPVADLESAIREGGGVVSGFHRGAHRAPDYDRAPALRPLTTQEAAERALGELVNARMWMERLGAAHLMGAVREACRGARCVLCVPGRLNETHQAIRSL